MRMYNKTKIKTMRLAAVASVTQAARDRQAGCLPPFIGQSGQSVAPAAEREEPNGPSSEAAPPPPQQGKDTFPDRHGMRYQGDVTPSPLKQRPNIRMWPL